MKTLAGFILALGVIRHLLWEHAPAKYQALVWNAAGSLSISVLLYLLWRAQRGWALGAVIIWFLYEEALVMICSIWRIIDWWPTVEGGQLCTEKVGPNLGAISLVAIGILISTVYHERPPV